MGLGLEAGYWALTAAFNLAFGALLVYLRLRVDRRETTFCQGFALTLLAAMFLLNGLNAALNALMAVLGEERASAFMGGFSEDVSLFVGFLLIAFALHFPRPFARRPILRQAQLSVVVAALVMSGLLLWLHTQETSGWSPEGVVLQGTYTVAYFGPVFLWMREVERQNSDQARAAVALVVWGFLLGPAVIAWALVIRSQVHGFPLDAATAVWATLVALAFGRLGLVVLRRSRRWAEAERLHLTLMVTTAALVAGVVLVVPASVGIESEGGGLPELTATEQTLQLIGGLLATVGWTWGRPLLLAFAILRFQMLGTQARMIDGLTWLAALLLSLSVALATAVTVTHPSIPAAAVVAVVTLLLVGPAFALVRRVMRRARHGAAAGPPSRPKARATYLASLQSAVVGGKVDDPADGQGLERLRARLTITPREHALLLSELSSYEEVQASGTVSRVMLVLADGRLIAHLGPSAVEADATMTASMLTAIRGFVAEGLSTEGGGELESISYGDQQLVMEAQEGIVLAATTDRADLPELRQLLGDWLSVLLFKYGPLLHQWDGTVRQVEPVADELQRLVSKDFPSLALHKASEP